MTGFVYSAPFARGPWVEVIREISKLAQKIIVLIFIFEGDDPSKRKE